MNTHKDKEEYPIYKSKCCGVGVSVSGIGITQYYVCNKCGKPCDFMPMTTSSKTNKSRKDKKIKTNYPTGVMPFRMRLYIAGEVKEVLGRKVGKVGIENALPVICIVIENKINEIIDLVNKEKI